MRCELRSILVFFASHYVGSIENWRCLPHFRTFLELHLPKKQNTFSLFTDILEFWNAVDKRSTIITENTSNTGSAISNIEWSDHHKKWDTQKRGQFLCWVLRVRLQAFREKQILSFETVNAFLFILSSLSQDFQSSAENYLNKG